MDHSTPHVEIQVRLTHKLIFFPSHNLESKHDTRTNYVTFHPSYWNLSKADGQTTSHSPSFWNPRKTDGQTTCHFNLHNSIHVRQMEKLCLISSSNWNIRMTDRRTNRVSFYPSFWNTSKIYGQIKNHFTPYIGIYARQTDGKTTFHFTPHIVVLDRQTDKLGFLSQLTWVSKTDRRTNYISFYSTCWYPSKADRQLYLLHPYSWNPSKTYEKTTLHFIPHIGIQVRQTESNTLSNISSLILQST